MHVRIHRLSYHSAEDSPCHTARILISLKQSPVAYSYYSPSGKCSAMNVLHGLILLVFVWTTAAYPNRLANEYDRLMDMYMRERGAGHDAANLEYPNEQYLVRRQNMYPFLPMQQPGPQGQQMCLPHIWTCGPGLPPCCPGLMCYDGNAKRGRHCVARG